MDQRGHPADEDSVSYPQRVLALAEGELGKAESLVDKKYDINKCVLGVSCRVIKTTLYGGLHAAEPGRGRNLGDSFIFTVSQHPQPLRNTTPIFYARRHEALMRPFDAFPFPSLLKMCELAYFTWRTAI